MKNKQKITNQARAWADFLDKIKDMHGKANMTYEEIGQKVGATATAVWEWLYKGKGGKRVAFEDMAQRLISVDLDPADYFDTGDNNFIQIPWVDAIASMGDGALIDSKHYEFNLAFHSDWLKRQGNPKNMVIINAVGGSMEPTIPDGALVLVDETESKTRYPANGQIYFVRKNGELFLKRLRVRQGKVISLISDCDGSEITVNESEDFAVLAKVIWFGKEV